MKSLFAWVYLFSATNYIYFVFKNEQLLFLEQNYLCTIIWVHTSYSVYLLG